MKRIVTLAFMVSLLATLAFTPAVSANAPVYTSTRTATPNECRAAVIKHRIKAGAPCRATSTYGAVTLRSYRVYVPPRRPSFTVACEPVRDPGCYGPPVPGRFYFVDSYMTTEGPGSLWFVNVRYHVKMDGYQVLQTGPESCEHTEFGVSITITDCTMHAIETAHGMTYELGANFRMCFVSDIIPFCATKGIRETINAWGYILSRHAW